MRCPYRKKVKVYPDGLGRTTEVDFMECDEKECPYWGAIAYNSRDSKWISQCRKAEKECS